MNAKVVVFLAALLIGLPLVCSGADRPSITWEIATSGDVKTYTYTVLNEAEIGPIVGIWIDMPTAAARFITSLHCSDLSFWTGIVPNGIRVSGGTLNTGASMQIWLQTPADIPTVYDYNTWSWHPQGNWLWWVDSGSIPGGYSVPVPSAVPEPLPLAALAVALSGFGSVLMKRKRR